MPKVQTVVSVASVCCCRATQKSISVKKKKKTAKRYTVEALLVMDDLVGFGFQPKHILTTDAC